MEKIRHLSNNIVFRFFIIVFALSFISWGATSQLTGMGRNNAITVNGEHIHIQDIHKEYLSQKRQLQTLLGEEVPLELEMKFGLGNRVVDRLIIEKLLESEAKEMGLAASPKAVRHNITHTAAFLDETGAFSKTRYKDMLRTVGSTTNVYENTLKKQYNIDNFNKIFASFLDDDFLLDSLREYEGKQLDVQYVVLNNQKGKRKIKPSLEEVKAYYDAHQDAYRLPEKRHFDVLTLTAKSMLEKIQVSEEDLHAYYEEHKDMYKISDQRRVQHILLKTKSDAEAAKQRLDEGASFENLVAELSEDSFSKKNKGDLGFSTKEELLPEISDVAFSLDINEISEPVQSDLGVHLIRVTDKKAPKQKTYAEVRSVLEENLKQDNAEDLYFDTLDALEASMDQGKTLAEAAKEASLKIRSYKNVKAEDVSLDMDDVWRDTAFALSENEISAPLEKDGVESVSFVQLTKISEEKLQSLKDVSSDIRTQLIALRLKENTQTRAEEYLQQLNKKDTLNTVAVSEKTLIQRAHQVSRKGENAPEWLQKFHLTNVFNLKEGEILSYPVTTGESFVILRVQNSVNKKWTPVEKELYANAFNKKRANDLANQYVDHLLSQAKIEMNKTLLSSVLGESFTK